MVLEAEKELKEAIRLEPKNLKRYDALNYVLGRIGDDFGETRVYKEIEGLNLRAARLAPTNSSWLIKAARALDKQGKTLQGEAKFKQVIQSFPNDAWSYAAYGLFLKDKGRYKEAEAQFKTALRLNTNELLTERFQNWLTEVIKLQ